MGWAEALLCLFSFSLFFCLKCVFRLTTDSQFCSLSKSSFWDLEDHVKPMIAMFSTPAMVKLDCVCIDQKTVYGN